MLNFEHFWKCTPEVYPLSPHFQIYKYATVITPGPFCQPFVDNPWAVSTLRTCAGPSACLTLMIIILLIVCSFIRIISANVLFYVIFSPFQEWANAMARRPSSVRRCPSVCLSLNFCANRFFSQANGRIATKLAHDGLQVSLHPGYALGQVKGQRSRDTRTCFAFLEWATPSLTVSLLWLTDWSMNINRYVLLSF